MSTHPVRSRSGRASAPLPDLDPLHRLYSVGVGITESGTLTVMVGRMDMHTRRYTFYRMNDAIYPELLRASVSEIVEAASWVIGGDPEMSGK